MAGGFKNIGEWQKTRTPEQRREQARKANRASTRAKREAKEIKDFLKILLDTKMTTTDGKKMTGAEAMATRAFREAIKGDWKAWELVRDTAGQKPADRVVVSDIDPDVISEVEAMVNGEDEQTNGG